eukprot:scaffold12654_cov113-Isochrysis_galbana.AAC.2
MARPLWSELPRSRHAFSSVSAMDPPSSPRSSYLSESGVDPGSRLCKYHRPYDVPAWHARSDEGAFTCVWGRAATAAKARRDLGKWTRQGAGVIRTHPRQSELHGSCDRRNRARAICC